MLFSSSRCSVKSSPAHSGMPPSRCSFSNFPFSINKILIMKYLLSANLWYIPELGALYNNNNKQKKKG